MAKQTRSVSGNVTSYVITDQQNNTVTVAVTQTPGTTITTLFTSSVSGLLNDGLAMVVTLLQLISTGIVP